MTFSFEQLRDIMVDTLAVDAEQVTPDAKLVEDLEADSLSLVEMAMALEEATGLTIEDEEAMQMKTVSDILDYINSHEPGEKKAPTPEAAPAAEAAKDDAPSGDTQA